jgi:Chloroplast import component protein (Tic20).
MSSPHSDSDNLPDKPVSQNSRPGGAKPPVLSEAGKTTIFDTQVPTNLILALSYAPLPLISQAAAVLTLIGSSEKPKFAKFHAIQALMLSVAMLVANGVLTTVSGMFGIIPLVGGLVIMLVSIVQIILTFAFMAYCVRMAYFIYQGKDVKVPFLSQYAEIWSDPK